MTFRVVGATARAMLIQAAAAKWHVPAAEVSTEPMRVVHTASGRSMAYGDLAADAARLDPPANVPLKQEKDFRLIGKPVKRVDSHDKSTGRARYGIDTRLDGMLYGAVVHAPRVGMDVDAISNEAAIRNMPGVHSVEKLPGALAVVADSFYRAKTAAAAATVTWHGGGVPEDFSSASQLATLKARFDGPGVPAENLGDVATALKAAARTITAEYDAPYLAHATMEPQNATARFNADGTLEVWVPNQAPDFFAQQAAKDGGVPPEQVRINSPLLGGFFGRRFVYGGEPMTQAILLAKTTGRPVKVVWTREEDISRDHYRPLSAVKLRGGLDDKGKLIAIHITAPGEGPLGRHLPFFLRNPAVDDSVVEGLTEKPYAIPNRRVDFVKVTTPANIGFWRSVAHSMNDFFYESFLDEIAHTLNRDPYEYRLALLRDTPRQITLLRAVADLAGGWRSAPYDRDGSRRAMGVAMASPFGSEVATIAEVSLQKDQPVVHDIWVAIDPGRIVNPAIATAQVQSAVAIGLSQTLFEEITFESGRNQQTNFDTYPFLPPDHMPRVHVRIIESGSPMGGIGEPATPGVAPAVCNAIATLSGRRIRSLPLAKQRFGET